MRSKNWACDENIQMNVEVDAHSRGNTHAWRPKAFQFRIRCIGVDLAKEELAEHIHTLFESLYSE